MDNRNDLLERLGRALISHRAVNIILGAAVTMLLALVALAVFAVAANAATTGPDRPATRADVAEIIVERALLADVTARDRLDYWVGSECAADLDGLTYQQRRKVCYVMAMGFMGDTGRNSAYPVFEPHATIRRDQTASVVQRLATQERRRIPGGAASFIDVPRWNVHKHAIRWGAYHGLLRGYDTVPATFGPARPVTIRQTRTLVDRVVGYWRYGEAR